MCGSNYFYFFHFDQRVKVNIFQNEPKLIKVKLFDTSLLFLYNQKERCTLHTYPGSATGKCIYVFFVLKSVYKYLQFTIYYNHVQPTGIVRTPDPAVF